MSAKKLTAEQVRLQLHGMAAFEGSQRALARRIGCSAAYLNDVLRQKREPSGPVLEFLGLKREVRYVQEI